MQEACDIVMQFGKVFWGSLKSSKLQKRTKAAPAAMLLTSQREVRLQPTILINYLVI